VRHGRGAPAFAWLEGGALVLGQRVAGAEEASLDGSGTVRAGGSGGGPLADGEARVRVWSAATLGYLAGLAAGALQATVAHAQAREQFGAPLAALPAVQARLADAKLLADGVLLLAWEAASPEDGDPALRAAALLWAGRAARDVTAWAHQAHGAVGFALESGVHRAYRRAKSLEAWTRAAVSAQA
jgi:alkylation response protein AidB-like acyl-CoA dehydrogenase